MICSNTYTQYHTHTLINTISGLPHGPESPLQAPTHRLTLPLRREPPRDEEAGDRHERRHREGPQDGARGQCTSRGAGRCTFHSKTQAVFLLFHVTPFGFMNIFSSRADIDAAFTGVRTRSSRYCPPPNTSKPYTMTSSRTPPHPPPLPPRRLNPSHASSSTAPPSTPPHPAA